MRRRHFYGIVLMALMGIVFGVVFAVKPSFLMPRQAHAACPVQPAPYGSVTTTVSVPASGNYRVWSRIMAQGFNNSYYLEIDDAVCGIVVGDNGSLMPSGVWTWVDWRNSDSASKITMNLTAGTHTVKLLSRSEPNVKLDKVLFVADQACVPSGTGENCAAPINTPTPIACKTSTATFQNTSIPTQTGQFTFSFRATPSQANMDGVIGLSRTAVTSYLGMAVLVRFNPNGVLDVRKGSAYAADTSIPYTPGVSYAFRVVVNVPAHTYSVYVTPAGGTERLLANNYAFRTEQASVPSLANIAYVSSSGSYTFCNPQVGGVVTNPTSTTAPTISSATPTRVPTATPTRTPNPTPVGGQINKTFVSYTANGYNSDYHLYAAGLDWTRPVGMLIYTDGSGEYGLKNPSSTYLLSGSTGMIAVAKKHNMILLTPFSPNKNCSDGDGSCWYLGDPSGYTKWAESLVSFIQSQYPIDKKRIAFGGYSSGAQLATEFWVPSGAAQRTMEDGVIVAISFGGSPKVTPVAFTASFKSHVHMSWDTGDQDSSYTTTSPYGVKAGYNYYTNAGFQTSLKILPGVTHDRWGDFGPVMDGQISQFVAAP